MKPKYLIIHHSASNWGDRNAIDRWHKSRGWRGCGYHKVILNGLPTYKHWATKNYLSSQDGKIQQGRPDNESGAHCKQKGMNRKSLGICMIGNFDNHSPTQKQLASLVDACARLCIRHHIPVSRVLFHNNFAHKSCPGKWFIGTYAPYSLPRLQKKVQERIDAYQPK